MSTTKTLKTTQDYFALPDDPRVELIAGEFYVVPGPFFAHQRAVREVLTAIHDVVRSEACGEVVPAPFDVILSAHDVVQPDVVFIAREHLDRIRGQLHGPPDVAVEVVSASNAERDRIVKRDLYARAGVPEFWLVDLAARAVEVLVLEDGAWRIAGIFEPGDDVVSPAFPDLDLPADRIFA